MAKASKSWSLEDDKQTLHRAVRGAAEIAMKFFKNDQVETWDKDNDTPVSEADIAVDKYLQSALMRNRPEYGWLSEETEDNADRLSCRRVWVVDPIDGTKAYLNGTDDWGISVALVYKGKPVLAVFYAVARDEFFEAEVGKGAFKNGEEIIVSWQKDISTARMQGCKNEFTTGKYWPLPWPKDMQYHRQNSIGLRLATVADGQADCCVSLRPKSEWDIAAADLIVREAGGLVTDGHGHIFAYNQKTPICAHVVASNRMLYSEVLTHFIPAREKWHDKG